MRKSNAIKWDICWPSVSNRSSEPLYHLQMIGFIKQEFNRKNYPDQQKMPSIRRLAKFLKVKPYCVYLAYKYLISLNEVLYTAGTSGTFMFAGTPADLKKRESNSINLLRAELLFPTQPAFFAREHFPEFNMLTIGSTYHWHFKKTLECLKYGYIPQIKKRVKTPGYYLFPQALNLLLERNILHNKRQLCVVPNGVALFKVFKNLVDPESKIACVGPNDSCMMETFSCLNLRPAFTGADEEGMVMDTLEMQCKAAAIKAVFVRISPDYPTPFSLTIRRWEQLKKLSKAYGFWIVVLDEDYEFSRLRLLNMGTLLNCNQVIYISVLSKLFVSLAGIGLIAGPEKFIRHLQQQVKRCFIGWDVAWEQSIATLIKGEMVDKDINTINRRCIYGNYQLGLLVGAYPGATEQLILPEAGTFGLLIFKKAIHPHRIFPLLNAEEYHQEENSSFDVKKPLNALRVSLCMENWKTLELVLKDIRGQPFSGQVSA